MRRIRTSGRLTAMAVGRANTPGRLADGDGLYLQITSATARSWIFQYSRLGKSHEMGLGALKVVGLASARARAQECRRLLSEGIDPIAARKAESTRKAIEDARAFTFAQCADAYIRTHSPSWTNAKHVGQWKATLETYVTPILGPLPVAAIDVTLVMKVLEPIWAVKPETAGRVRGRIESILNWAKARGYRMGENPAQWKGHLDNLLPSRGKISRVKHHAALPYDQTARFLENLRRQEGSTALALEFAILTAARTGEVLGARWSEFDLDGKLWTVPATRMKGGRDHRVPLSRTAMEVLAKLSANSSDEFVFCGRSRNPLSSMALLMLLRRMNLGEITVHGFRSTFRDWAAERTNFPREVAEAALAHTLGDKVEAAYRRGDFFEKRRRLMASWADFATKPQQIAEVFNIHQTHHE